MTLTITYEASGCPRVVMSSHDDIRDAHAAVRARFSAAYRVESLALCGVVLFEGIDRGRIAARRVATYRITP
ncbi:hypothetical protein [Mycobacteroides abscessus]|uniref:hypothetical protein n=1 Tax=Mycobacteroides abscessus TaxID=36809 RepID=UPI0009A893D6|nr:hypothetical protein [Mycobacteroides abscessus]SLJ09241.1 Uncharacterised protein [Mycobacteroides abscessus subsp. abscessus]